MYGCVLVPPNPGDGDFGILFLHNEGYSTMCGHAVIAISKLAVAMNWLPVQEGDNILKIDAPCGRITSYTTVDKGKITNVRFECVPSFVVALDRPLRLEGYGEIKYDLAYGGAFYAYVDAAQLDLALTPENHSKLIEVGMAIKHAVMAQDQDILHPFEDDLSFLYGTIFTGAPLNQENDSRNVCIFANGEVDRSPTGSGVAGRMAIHYARKELQIGEIMHIESITDSVFSGRVLKEIDFGQFTAVVPEVGGQAYITGRNSFIIDPEDPFKEGFLLR
jgi:trans-L-3-hydroxyproline dehydratase